MLSRDTFPWETNTLRLDFQSLISLVADEIFVHEKCSDQICCPSNPSIDTPLAKLSSVTIISLTRCKNVGYDLLFFLIFAEENFADDMQNA